MADNAQARSGIVSTRIYELLPQHVRNNDPEDALKALFGAAQQEYDRNKDSIHDVLMLVDPLGINNQFRLSGSPSFLNDEQFLPFTSSTSNTLVFSENPSGSSVNDYYVGFGIYVVDVRDPAQSAAIGQYRMVMDYDATTKTATLDKPFTNLPSSGGVVALCYPDRIWLPTPIVSNPTSGRGTVLPDQSVAPDPRLVVLPATSFISDRPNYFEGWTLQLLDGEATFERRTILSYTGSDRAIVRAEPDDTGVGYSVGDLVRITYAGIRDATFRIASVTASGEVLSVEVTDGGRYESTYEPSGSVTTTVVSSSGQANGLRLFVFTQAYLAELNAPFSSTPATGQWFQLIQPEDQRVSTENDFYKDRFVRVLSFSKDSTATYPFRVETRRILRSEYRPDTVPASHVCFVYDADSKRGEPFTHPPDPDFFVGITDHHVSLNYLARNLGFRLDSQDPEDLQREQVRQAFSFYKLKGTRRAFELICRSFGLDVNVVELSQNYVRPPHPELVDGETLTFPDPSRPDDVFEVTGVSPAYRTGFWDEVDSIPQTGLGEDDVPTQYLVPPGQASVRIPSSDIKLFLARIDPRIAFDGGLLVRILDKVEDVRPIHIEILSVGIFETVSEGVDVTENFSATPVRILTEGIDVIETFQKLVLGSPVKEDAVGVDTQEYVTVYADLRYDVRGTYDSTGRIDVGDIIFEG